jgi:ElaB/YqjD/DUF883 family membrane-anchored ribosome-binding protein
VASDSERGLSSDEIRADIEQTRERLGQTVETLGAQLNPSHLAQRVKDSVREATIGRVQDMATRAKENVAESGRGIANVIRENPVQAAIVAAGIGWMLMKNRDRDSGQRYGYDRDYDYRDRGEPNVAQRAMSGASSVVEDAASGVKEIAHDVAERAQDVAHDVSEKAKSATDRVTYKTRSTMRQIEDRYQDSPIALGAFAVAAGLAIGFSMPTSRKEAQIMGGVRDELVDKAKEQLAETTEKVENVVDRAAPQVRNVVRDAAREEGFRS